MKKSFLLIFAIITIAISAKSATFSRTYKMCMDDVVLTLNPNGKAVFYFGWKNTTEHYTYNLRLDEYGKDHVYFYDSAGNIVYDGMYNYYNNYLYSMNINGNYFTQCE